MRDPSVRPVKPLIKTPDGFDLVVATLNINGVINKREQLELAIHEKGIHLLGLQETLETSTRRPVTLHGMTTFRTLAHRGASKRGQIIAITKKASANLVGFDSPYVLAIQASLPGFGEFIAATVYVPHATAERKEALGHLAALVKKYSSVPDVPVIIMGDFNQSGDRLIKRVSKVDGAYRLLINSNGSTRFRSKRAVAIDHILVKESASLTAPMNSHTDEYLDLSDHKVLLATVRLSGNNDSVRLSTPRFQDRIVVPDSLKKLAEADLETWPSSFRDAVQSNRFALLCEEILGTEILDEEDAQAKADHFATKFQRAVVTEARNMGLVQEGGSKTTRGLNLNNKVKRAIEKRRKAFKALRLLKQNKGSSAQEHRLWHKYWQARESAALTIKSHRRRRYLSAIIAADKAVHTSPKLTWAHAKNNYDTSLGLAASSPAALRDADGILQAGDEKVINTFRSYYANIFDDPTGCSRNSDQWADLMGPDLPALEGLNNPIEMAELLAALRKSRWGKAPGVDCVPMCFYKLTMCNEKTALAKCLLALMNLIFQNTVPPTVDRVAHIVNIYKKGDPTDPDNYRPISLLNTAQKILTRILATRIEGAMEDAGRFSPAQSGFRRLHECVLHACCLHEIKQRRTARGRKTYKLFVDLRKAYDSVPHMCLIRKLQYYGVTGTTLRYIDRLYANGQGAIRVGNRVSQPFDIKRGVRQGCPMSPILFNIFINDILDETTPFGVKVDGCPTPVSGLLFADDCVTLAPTKSKMRMLADRLTAWLNKNCMTANNSKCAVVAAVKGGSNNRKNHNWQLQNQSIPSSDEYRYLGLVMDGSNSTQKMIADRAASGNKKLGLSTRYLRDTKVSVSTRRMTLLGDSGGSMLYGGELFGMNKCSLIPLQRVLNKGLRHIVHASNSVSLACLYRELNVAPIHALMAGRKTRGILKAADAKTWLGSLARHRRFRGRTGSWLRNGLTWLKTRTSMTEAALFEDDRITPKRKAEKVKLEVWEGMDKKWALQCPTFDSYAKANFSPLYTTKTQFPGALGLGACMIIRARCGDFKGAPAVQRAIKGPELLRRVCPFCLNEQPETFCHLLISCPKWAEWRRALLEPYIREATDSLQPDAYSEQNATILLLGGRVNLSYMPKWGDHRDVQFELLHKQIIRESNDAWLLNSKGLYAGEPSLHVAAFLTLVTRARAQQWAKLEPLLRNWDEDDEISTERLRSIVTSTYSRSLQVRPASPRQVTEGIG
jgi:hypothetical protein